MTVRYGNAWWLATAVLVALAGTPAARGAEGELSFYTSWNSGDYGTGVSADSQIFTTRYVWGDAFQIRVELPVIRLQSSTGVLQTGFGTMPLEGRHGNDSHMGGGPGGTGHGPMGATLPQPATVPTQSYWESGLGDLRVALSRRLVGGGVRLFRLDAGLEVKAPTADENRNLGTGQWDLRVFASGAYRFWSATGFAGVGYSRLGDPSWIDLENIYDGWLGVESDPIAGGRLTVSGWIEARQAVVASADDYAALGLGLQTTGRRRWRAAVLKGVGNGSQDLSVIVGLAWGLNPPSWNKALYR